MFSAMQIMQITVNVMCRRVLVLARLHSLFYAVATVFAINFLSMILTYSCKITFIINISSA